MQVTATSAQSSVTTASPVTSDVIPPSTSSSTVPTPAVATRLDDILQSSPEEAKKTVRSSKLHRPKQIPTILGLLILIGSLTAGILLFGNGTGVFAPRATPETTPKNVLVSNVTDKSFTVSFYTDEETPGFIEYGDAPANLKQQSSDDRDQLSGVVKSYRLHHVTVRGLQPGTQYYYKLGTGTNTFDQDGQAYVVKTAAKPTLSPTSNQTIYGVVNLGDGTAANGSVVYLYNEKMGVLSALVKESGSFGISLSTAFTPDGAAYAQLLDTDTLQIKVQGIEPSQNLTTQVKIAEAQPVPTLVFGQNATTSANVSPADVDKEALLASESSASADASAATTIGEPIAESSASANSSSSATVSPSQLADTAAPIASVSSAITPTVSPTPAQVVDLTKAQTSQPASAITVNTTQPQVKAVLPANTMVKITIHSEAVIEQTVQTNEKGEVVLDVASLGKNLEPGEHTATYTYIDPTTGQEVTKTYNFTVAGSSGSQTTQQIAAVITATPTPTKKLTPTPTPTPTSAVPYGSGNPYLPSPTASASTTAATIKPTKESTRSAIVATDSGQYNSGSVGTTFVLLMAALFFIGTGIWSFYLAGKFEGKAD